MKFNKELEENAVPEWRVKYLNYKQGKKKLKAVARAIRNVDSKSPRNAGQRTTPSLRDGPVYAFLRGKGWAPPQRDMEEDTAPLPSHAASSVWETQDDLENGPTGVPIQEQVDERSPLKASDEDGEGSRPHMRRYGSIIGSPPGSASPAYERLSKQKTNLSLLELPNPALGSADNGEGRVRAGTDDDRPVSPGEQPSELSRAGTLEAPPRPPPTQMAHTGNAYEVRPATDLQPTSSLRSGIKSALKRNNSTPTGSNRPRLLQRVYSAAGGTPASNTSLGGNDVALEAYREFDFRKAEFFHFLDNELEKVDSFYKEKEQEAKERLEDLRQQLHILREMRLHDIEEAERRKKGKHAPNGDAKQPHPNGESENHHFSHYRHSVASQMGDAFSKVRTGHVGKTAKAMRDLGTPPVRPSDAHTQDYTSRPQQSVTYRAGKRKLKHAFIEYYRSLGLLKSYALLNHTGFRKITKKADKTMSIQEGAKWLRDAVNTATFISTEGLDLLVVLAEDLYARYFERGSRSAALAKLRNPGYRSLSFEGNTWRAGGFFFVGLFAAILGLVAGVQQADGPLPLVATQASYLLQIYAGFFLLIFFAMMFCIACREWKAYKVNYALILELDFHHHLDWHQLTELASLFMLYLGIIMAINFDWVGPESVMYTKWPLVMLGISAITIFFPFAGLYVRSRMWLITSTWRLFFAGLYAVEFRDVLLGDVFCSMTYVFGNVELFFCLYQKEWHDPPQCNSSSSILFGIFTTIPGIMRAAQCFRRYWDSGNAFPHLANLAKYCCTIAMYACLAAFRLNRGWELLTLFAVAASVNSLYCSFWDVFIDWSLGDLKARKPLLRDMLLFERTWWYYSAIILDILLRFNWIFYVIFVNDLQHSSIVSFMVAASEVFRRGVWSVFRLENEQISFNKKLFAARRPSLPFSVAVNEEEEPATAAAPSPLAQTLRRVGSAMTSAHEQDYVRRRVRKQSEDLEEEDEDED